MSETREFGETDIGFLDGDHGDEAEEEVKSAIAGAKIDLDKLQREDGLLTRGLENTQLGVLQKAMGAISRTADYRQELKTAFFVSSDEADRVVAAINEARRYGCSLDPIVDWLIARSSGINASRLRVVLEAFSHRTVTTNYQKDRQNSWSSKDNGGKNRFSIP